MPKRRRITTAEEALARMLDKPQAPRSRMGGWRGHPASLAALERHRPKTAPPERLLSPRCRCGRAALRGRTRCHFHDDDWLMSHDGWRELTVARRAAQSGALPAALAAHPVFREVTTRTDRIEERGAVLRDLVAGWLAMDRGQDDGQAWTAALARAQAAGWTGQQG